MGQRAVAVRGRRAGDQVVRAGWGQTGRTTGSRLLPGNSPIRPKAPAQVRLRMRRLPDRRRAMRLAPLRMALPIRGRTSSKLRSFRLWTERNAVVETAGGKGVNLLPPFLFGAFSIQAFTQIWVPHPRRVFVFAARVGNRRCPDRMHMSRERLGPPRRRERGASSPRNSGLG